MPASSTTSARTPGKGAGGGTGLEGGDAGQRGDEYHARFRLPPSIHHGDTVAANVLTVPDPRFRVDGLAHGTQQAQAGEVVSLGVFLTPAHAGADGRGSGVTDGAAILLDDGPPAVTIREVGGALVHHRGGPVGKGAIDDVAVACDPADVGGAPVDVVFLEVEYPLGGGVCAHHVPSGSVHDALGLARGA